MDMDPSMRTRLAGCLGAATAALAVMAPIAHAGDRKAERAEKAERPERAERAETVRSRLGAQAPACADRTFASVFRAWHDRSLYTLADGGDFETQAAGWTLAGPASIARDSSPFLLGAAVGSSSVELAAGASAVSPPICVSRGYPSFRFLTRSVGAAPGVVKVQVLYAARKAKLTGWVAPRADWAPTRILSLGQGRFRIRRTGSAVVRLRLTAIAGTVRLDDVYVDPRYNR
jgi:hypothetical protein